MLLGLITDRWSQKYRNIDTRRCWRYKMLSVLFFLQYWLQCRLGLFRSPLPTASWHMHLYSAYGVPPPPQINELRCCCAEQTARKPSYIYINFLTFNVGASFPCGIGYQLFFRDIVLKLEIPVSWQGYYVQRYSPYYSCYLTLNTLSSASVHM